MVTKQVAVFDYGSGNVRSVVNALRHIGVDAQPGRGQLFENFDHVRYSCEVVPIHIFDSEDNAALFRVG